MPPWPERGSSSCPVRTGGGPRARRAVQGVAPELWNVERPEVVKGVYAAYFAAGADVVSTNSFGGTPLKLAAHGLEGRAYELNLAAARLAREAAPAGRYGAG